MDNMLEINKISTPGEKLRIARKHVGLSQKELAEGICTNSNICKYESGAHEIPASRINCIIDKINQTAKEKGINIHINMEWLFENEQKQIENLLLKKINNFDELSEHKKNIKVEEIISMLNKNKNINIDVKIKALKLLNGFFYVKSNLSEAMEWAEQGYIEASISFNNKERCIFMIRKAAIEIKRKDYIRAYSIIEDVEAIDLNKEFDSIIKTYKLIINERCNNSKLIIKSLEFKGDLSLDEYNLLAKSYIKEKIYDKAKTTLKNFLNLALKEDRSDCIVIAYRNLSEVYLRERNIEESKYYLKLRFNVNSTYHLEEHYNFAGEVYFNSNIKKSLKYFNKAKEIVIKNKTEDDDLISSIYCNLILAHIKNKNNDEVILLIDESSNKNINIYNVEKYIFKYILETGTYEDIKSIIKKIKKI